MPACQRVADEQACLLFDNTYRTGLLNIVGERVGANKVGLKIVSVFEHFLCDSA